MKRWFTLLLSLITILVWTLSLGATVAFAQEETEAETTESSPPPELDGGYAILGIEIVDSADSCHTFGRTKEELCEGAACVVTEISEPIGSIDEKIKTGALTVSEVVWKFNCEIYEELVEYKNGGGETFVYGQGEPEKKLVSIYRDYNLGCPDGYSCSLIQLVKGQSGTGIIKTYISIIYRWSTRVVGIVAVLVMVVSGVQISIDQGSGENVSAAKTRIFESLAALAVLFLSALILYTINPEFFQR